MVNLVAFPVWEKTLERITSVWGKEEFSDVEVE